MNAAGNRRGSPGFTLIELMIVVAIFGIFVAIMVPVEIRSQRMAESEVALQKANQALRSEVEVLRSMPYQKLESVGSLPFDKRVAALSELVEATGVVKVEPDPARPGLLKLKVELTWRDARLGMRSIHTVLYKAGRRGVMP